MPFTSELEARRFGMEVAGFLGPGWQPRVFDNMGWHVTVVKGGVQVRPSPLSRAERENDLMRLTAPFMCRFSVLIGDPKKPYSGYCFGASMGSGGRVSHTDPKEAVRLYLDWALEQTRPHVETLSLTKEIVSEWDETPEWEHREKHPARTSFWEKIRNLFGA
jgi:hypothetical protein